MSILNVNNINPVGSGRTITVNNAVNGSAVVDITGSLNVAAVDITGSLNVAAGDINGEVGIGTDTNLTAKLTVGNIENTGVTNKGATAFKTLNSSGGVGEAAIYLEEQSGNEGWYLKVNSSGDLQFNDSGASDRITFQDGGKVGIGPDDPAEKLSVAGNVRVQNSADAAQYLNLTYQGIDFQNTGAGSSTTSSAHLLDDYEEGTWTPTYLGTTGNPTITYLVQDGVYTKIGNTVHCQGRLQTDAASGGSGNLLIGNFPFQCKTGNDRGVVNIGYSGTWDTQAPETGHMENGGTRAFLRFFNGTGATTVTVTNLRNVSTQENDILFDVTYEVA